MATPVTAHHIIVTGAVQGVGFRPFVYRLAHEIGLTGAVRNTPKGVSIDIEGPHSATKRFIARLAREVPPLARIDQIEATTVRPTGAAAFDILSSDALGNVTASLLPDAATCAACVAETTTPKGRRYRYPFTNCTNCGPRYSILNTLPYDRANTTMRDFIMCAACTAEYTNPLDRRFHAQPIACPDCGPHLSFTGMSGDILATKDDAMAGAADALRRGAIVAVKGLGGFHLLCDARNSDPVAQLRQRKNRPTKPFAVMFGSLGQAETYCTLDAQEKALLTSHQAPILLARRRKKTRLSDLVAPGAPYLGAMIPYTPLHHILMRDLGFPVIATSGNRCSEPIEIDNNDALRRLGGIADYFLLHDRPIARPVEDSVAGFAAGKLLMYRRARGFAPASVAVTDGSPPILAVGGHLKNVIAKTVDDSAILSPHIGDLDSSEARRGFDRTLSDFSALHSSPPAIIVSDKHRDYYSSQVAARQSPRHIRVQHHRAHVYAVMAEHHFEEPALGVAWDGAGAGDDGTIWGGEVFLIDQESAPRVAHFLPFPLPGGEQAMQAPARSAFGMATKIAERTPHCSPEILDRLPYDQQTQAIYKEMINKRINTPMCSSVGRIFDAVAAILGLCSENRFEGEAAMAVQFAGERTETGDAYEMPLNEACSPKFIDWRPMLSSMLREATVTGDVSLIARKFHNTLANTVVACAIHFDRENIILSGGCFQNRLLLETTIARLSKAGFRPIWPQTVPPNDGGLALGQIHGALRQLRSEAS